MNLASIGNGECLDFACARIGYTPPQDQPKTLKTPLRSEDVLDTRWVAASKRPAPPATETVRWSWGNNPRRGEKAKLSKILQIAHDRGAPIENAKYLVC
jgi:hypothetical protein